MITSLMLRMIRLGWTVIHDVTPKHTLDEIGLVLDSIRHQAFNSEDATVQDRLESQLQAARHAYAVLVKKNISDASVQALQERVSTLHRILESPADTRDVLAGSLFSSGELSREFQRVGDQVGTGSYILREAKGVAGRLFEDRELRVESIQLQAKIIAQRDILSELRPLMTETGRSIVDAKLQALDIAYRTVKSKTVKENQQKDNPTSKRHRIPID